MLIQKQQQQQKQNKLFETEFEYLETKSTSIHH